MKNWIAFQEIETRYFSLLRQFETRRISAQQYAAAVQQLRFQDAQGIWWQMRPQDGAWLRWNGVSWDAALPPHLWGPQTLVDLILSILKDLFRGLLWKLPLCAGAALMVWAIHTALIVGPNGGLAFGKNALLDMVLALPGSLIPGILFWTVLAGLTATIFARVARLGLNQTLQDMISTPAWVEYVLSGSEGNILIPLLSGCVLALLLGVIVGNRLVSFLLVVMSLGALISQSESRLLRCLRLAWSDSLRLRNHPPRPFNAAWGGLVIIGTIFGYMVAVILPRMPYTGCVGVLLITGMIAFLVLLRQENRLGRTALLLPFISLAALVNPDYAREINGSGLWLAIVYGILPAMGAFCGCLLGLTLGGLSESSPPRTVVTIPAQHLVEAGPQPSPAQLPASSQAQPPPIPPSDGPVILKGQPAMDVLVRLGMVKRMITPQGGRYLAVDLEPQGPISAIAYHMDEQGVLNPMLAIAYSPPAFAPELIEQEVQVPEEPPPLERDSEAVDTGEGEPDR